MGDDETIDVGSGNIGALFRHLSDRPIATAGGIAGFIPVK
jgi:hypothetical protein